MRSNNLLTRLGMLESAEASRMLDKYSRLIALMKPEMVPYPKLAEVQAAPIGFYPTTPNTSPRPWHGGPVSGSPRQSLFGCPGKTLPYPTECLSVFGKSARPTACLLYACGSIVACKFVPDRARLVARP
jgi:hypothetical protein